MLLRGLYFDYRFYVVELLSSGPRGFKRYRNYIIIIMLIDWGDKTADKVREEEVGYGHETETTGSSWHDGRLADCV